MSLLSKLKKSIFGYDIFISYARKDSLDYSYSIAEYFMGKGYECYIDQLSNLTPGESLPLNIQTAIKHSTAFVLIGSEGAQTSVSIEKEIELFFKNNENNPFIPINIAGAINQKAIWSKKITGLALIDDTVQNLKAGTPAQNVLNRIDNALSFTRKAIRLRTIALAVLLGIICISGLSATFAYNKAQEAAKAITARDSAQQQLVITNHLKNTAEIEKTEALERLKKANKLKDSAEFLKNTAIAAKQKADSLASMAQSRVTQLKLESNMLQYRVEAMANLESDPVKAFRFGEIAYNLKKSPQNRNLLLSALSSIDYYYTSVIKNYRIADFKEPYILLVNNEKKLAVFDMKSLELKETSLHADFAWVIPIKNSWRILTKNWYPPNNKFDPNPIYQLWDNSSKPLSDVIMGEHPSIIRFRGLTNVVVKLPQQLGLSSRRYLFWDLLKNEEVYIDDSLQHQKVGQAWYSLMATPDLDIRNDRVEAVYCDRHKIGERPEDGKSGLALTSQGMLDTSTFTVVAFDPFRTYTKWSPDKTILAVNHYVGKRLGLWNPELRYFTWLDGEGWIVDTYAWSQNGHLLAFSGHTEYNTDVTVEIVDASIPEKTRRVIYQSSIPISTITFLPTGDKVVICDVENNMYKVDIASKKILGKGQQALFAASSSSGLYTSTWHDVKLWSVLSAPFANWVFKSTNERKYLPLGAASPSNKQIAVPFLVEGNDTIMGIEVRNCESLQKLEIYIPRGQIHNTEFTPDGQWLIAVASSMHPYEVHCWNTTNWQHLIIPCYFVPKNFEIRENMAHCFSDSFDFQVPYVCNLTDQNPKFIQKGKIKKEHRQSDGILSPDPPPSIKDWKIHKLYKYRGENWTKSKDWSIRIMYRDATLGAEECDIQFIPSNIEWLMKLYDRLLWKPSKEELNKIY